MRKLKKKNYFNFNRCALIRKNTINKSDSRRIKFGIFSEYSSLFLNNQLFIYTVKKRRNFHSKFHSHELIILWDSNLRIVWFPMIGIFVFRVRALCVEEIIERLCLDSWFLSLVCMIVIAFSPVAIFEAFFVFHFFLICENGLMIFIGVIK